MFAARYFAARYFPPRYFPEVGADPPPVTGGPVWVWVNGVVTPPGTSVQGTHDKWMWINGAVRIPADPKRSKWPRRAHGRDEC